MSDIFTLDELSSEYGNFKDKNGYRIEETVNGNYKDLELKKVGEQNGRGMKLEEYVLDRERDLFICDSHNNALAAWIAAYNSDLVGDDSTLVHIDEHSDGRSPLYDSNKYSLQSNTEKVEDCISKTGITEFIEPAKSLGIVPEVKNWGVKHFNGFSKQNEKGLPSLEHLEEIIESSGKFIMDIDIDVFSGMVDGAKEKKYNDLISKAAMERDSWVNDQEFDSFIESNLEEEPEVNFEKYYKTLAQGMKEAEFTTMATSPATIGQEEALQHVYGIFKNY